MIIRTPGAVALAVALAFVAALPAEAEEHPQGADQEAAEPASPPEAEAEGTSEAPAGEAPAEEPSPQVVEARARVARGEALFARGNFDAALVEFQQAYDVIGEHPNRYLILYNIGQCHERSFRYDQALRFYRQYLEEGGEQAEGREEVEQAIARLEALLASVRIDVDVDQAEVWVDERLVGTAPGTVRIPGGSHTVEVRAPGHLPSRQEVQVPAGGEVDMSFSMEPLPERFRGLHRAYFWASAGTAAASLVVGLALGVVAFRQHSEVDRRLGDEREQWTVTQADIDRIGTLALAADVFFAASALFTAGAVVFGLLADWGRDDQDEAATARRGSLRLGAAASGHGGSVVLGGWF